MKKVILILIMLISFIVLSNAKAQLSWNVSDNLDTLLFGSINSNKLGNIFVGGGEYGVYSSTNNGENWIAINNVLTDINVHDFELISNGYLIAVSEIDHLNIFFNLCT